MKLRFRLDSLLIVIAFCLTGAASAQVAWWEPESPNPGDLITIYYDTDPGIIPPGNIRLHWGINNWTEPPEDMWPPFTVVADPGQSVQSPMNFYEGTVWSILIQTDLTVEQLDFVFTNGNVWDNNNGSDWHIYLGAPPAMTWHRFTLDTRNGYLGYTPQELGTVYLKGEFNGWNDSMPMNGPDELGVYWYDVHLMEVQYAYKFNAQGDIWMQDPDNPLTDGGQYNNSVVVPVAKSQPYLYGIRPFDGEVFPAGSNVNVRAKIYPSDVTGAELSSVVLRVDAQVHPEIVFDAESGELSGTLAGLAEGQHSLYLTVTDADNVTAERFWPIAIHTQGQDGYLALDPDSDADGTGFYTSPTPDHAADLLQFELTELANGDSILFSIDMEYIAMETRVMVQIAASLDGQPATTSDFATEVALPDFDGVGVQIALANPEADFYDPNFHNRLVIHRNPTEYGPAVDMRNYMDGVIEFAVSVADLEAVLGSYSSDWYYSIYSHYEGFDPTTDHSWEIGPDNGGLAETYDPDAFDALFMENRELQRTMFANHTSNRLTTFDHVGRGIAAIAPGEIGPDIGSSGPVVRWVTRDWTTVQETKILYASIVDDGVNLLIHHQWSDGETTYDLGPVNSGQLEYEVTLQPGENLLQLEGELGGEVGVSPILTIFHDTPQAPVAVLNVSVDGDQIVLSASQCWDPQEQPLMYAWSADPDNPEPVNLVGAFSSIATFDIPATLGEYSFDIELEDTDNNITHARTMVDINADGIEPFTLDKSADWVRDAIIYEIYVRSYNASESLLSVTADMQHIHNMGFNCIWLMPIQPGPSTHGYAITDYYGIEEDYGAMEDFDNLVDAAHSYGIKVVMDLVINHSAVEHPWMQDAFALGEASNTYDWYDRDVNGDYTYYYDWVSLPNLNYSNPDLRKYMIDMSKWWIEEHQVDGFRCDVAWGPQQRYPDFWPEWRMALKTIKPEAFLLAEADVTDFTFLTDRFDSAYDWPLHHGANGDNFVDLFSSSFTDPAGLQNRIMNYGFDWPEYTFPFRFMENHDEARYISEHTAVQTKSAATMLLTIPGIPLIYAGQEVGETSQRGLIHWNNDPNNLRGTYGTLVELRNRLPVLRSTDQVFLQNDQGDDVYSYGRYEDGENTVVVALNITGGMRNTVITVPAADWNIEPGGDYYLTDVFANDSEPVAGADLVTISYSLPPYTARAWVISDTSFVLDVNEPAQLPNRWRLDQNFPNPFNPGTQIRFTLATPSQVNLSIYNVLGQRVATLVNQRLSAGSHLISFDGRDQAGNWLASGVYFYRLEAGDFVRSRKMVMLK